MYQAVIISLLFVSKHPQLMFNPLIKADPMAMAKAR